MIGASPEAYFEKFKQKEERDSQFSEDIRSVIYSGYGSASNSAIVSAASTRSSSLGAAGSRSGRLERGGSRRTLSPGLSAGAALCLGSSCASPSSANTGAGAQAFAEAREAGRSIAAHHRRPTNPFDDHSAFIEREVRKASGFTVAPVVDTNESRVAYQAAVTSGKNNRELQQGYGAQTPWDAPEKAPVPALGSMAMPCHAGHHDLQHNASLRNEAGLNKARVNRIGENPISGNYLHGGGDGPGAPVGCSARPPRPERLLPQAQMMAVNGGMSCKNLTTDQTAYLNSKVGLESNRERNAQDRIRFG